MKIVVVTESSTVEKNKDVIAALDGFGHEIINIGMKKLENEPVNIKGVAPAQFKDNKSLSST